MSMSHLLSLHSQHRDEAGQQFQIRRRSDVHVTPRAPTKCQREKLYIWTTSFDMMKHGFTYYICQTEPLYDRSLLSVTVHFSLPRWSSNVFQHLELFMRLRLVLFQKQSGSVLHAHVHHLRGRSIWGTMRHGETPVDTCGHLWVVTCCLSMSFHVLPSSMTVERPGLGTASRNPRIGEAGPDGRISPRVL